MNDELLNKKIIIIELINMHKEVKFKTKSLINVNDTSEFINSKQASKLVSLYYNKEEFIKINI